MAWTKARVLAASRAGPILRPRSVVISMAAPLAGCLYGRAIALRWSHSWRLLNTFHLMHASGACDQFACALAFRRISSWVTIDAPSAPSASPKKHFLCRHWSEDSYKISSTLPEAAAGARRTQPSNRPPCRRPLRKLGGRSQAIVHPAGGLNLGGHEAIPHHSCLLEESLSLFFLILFFDSCEVAVVV